MTESRMATVGGSPCEEDAIGSDVVSATECTGADWVLSCREPRVRGRKAVGRDELLDDREVAWEENREFDDGFDCTLGVREGLSARRC